MDLNNIKGDLTLMIFFSQQYLTHHSKKKFNKSV